MPTSDGNPRFTVIIPAKDRAPYLHQTLRTCSLQDYDNLEVIVSDDESTDDTRDVVTEAVRKDPRIRLMTPTGSGMLDNFESALDQVKPGYVVALGSDDGLLPHGIRGMRDALRDSGLEMVAWPAPMYFYPKVRMPCAQMVVHIKGGKPQTGERVISSRTFLQRQAKELHYVGDIESPMFYVKGAVSTKLVDTVRKRTPGGRFYACPTPDGYSGIVLAGEVDSWAFSGKPFSLHGVSPTSAGVTYFANTTKAQDVSEAFYKSVKKRPMHADLGSQPYSPLIALMTADYLFTARDLSGWPGTRPAIDIRAVLLRALAELQDGLMAENRVARELTILNGVAEHHGLGEFFRGKVKNSRRNTRKPLEGNAYSPKRMYLDGDQLGLENVFDAAYFAYNVHGMSSAFTASSIWHALTNSARYKVRSIERGAAFPPESEWLQGSRQGL